jgi:hypothetical protein
VCENPMAWDAQSACSQSETSPLMMDNGCSVSSSQGRETQMSGYAQDIIHFLVSGASPSDSQPL